MRTVGRIIGWILILVGVVAIPVIVWLVVSERIPGNFLSILLLAGPAILAIIIGTALARAGSKATTSYGDPDPQWTRRNLR
jgi:hypothetical protein